MYNLNNNSKDHPKFYQIVRKRAKIGNGTKYVGEWERIPQIDNARQKSGIWEPLL